MLCSDQWVLEDEQGLLPTKKWQKTVNVMARIFKAPAGFIVQHSAEGYQVVIASKQDSNPYPAASLIPADTNIFCRKIVETGQELYVRNAASDPFWDDNPEVANDGFLSYYGLPLFWPDGTPFGTICVMDFETTEYHHDYLELMSELRDLLESDLILLDQYQTIRELAVSDELTQLYNRRGFFNTAKPRLALAKRNQGKLGLLYLDADNLKMLNDNKGHKKGDLHLQQLADVICENIREDDIAARIGGDEFVVLSSSDTQLELNILEQRLSKDLDKQGISVSIGSVLIDDPNKDLHSWLSLADERMYEQKKIKLNNLIEG